MDNNYAFIDGQNLYLGTTKATNPWMVDLRRFRVYLRDKYHVTAAYYFLGYFDVARNNLYQSIQEAGYILMFREHNSDMSSIKKGNVDTDIVFTVMKMLYKQENFDDVILVSGDGDYWRLVDFLIEEDRFLKLLAPNRNSMSSLYKRMSDVFRDFMDVDHIKRKIGAVKK